MGSSSSSAAPTDWARFEPDAACGSTFMRAHFTDHRFERHSHETFSIGLTRSGVQCFRCDGTRHASLPGDLILFNPDQAHDGERGSPEGFGYEILYVPTEVIADCRDAAAGIDVAGHFRQVVVRDVVMARSFAATVGALGQAGERLRAESLMRGLLGDLLSRHGEQVREIQAVSAGGQRMARVREYLHGHFAEDVGVDALAVQAGVSRAHLSRAFARQYGVPPHVYLNAVRLRRAREAMKSGRGLAEVAVGCGFADQSHFTRRFKGAMGVTPAQWMRQMGLRAD